MSARTDVSPLIGERFGRLAVTGPAIIDGMVKVRCACDCGTTTYLRRAKLRAGHTRSCGCLKREIVARGAHRS